MTQNDLSTTEAQYLEVIEGKTLGDVPVIPEHDAANIAHDIKVLDDLAKQLRARRLQAGCVKTRSLRLTFKLDENGMPIDCGQYERDESHSLIEEVRRDFSVIRFIGQLNSSSSCS